MRTQLQASAVSSYMGIGFRTPEEQFLIDTGQEKPVFTKEQQLRMELGNYLEEGTLNYFETANWLNEPIFDRNTEVREGLNGMVRYKIDGRTEDAVVDAKITSGEQAFVFNKGYLCQLHIYMMAEGLRKAHLIGVHQGTPKWRTLHFDDEFAQDILEVVTYVYGMLNGINDWDNYPYHILDKYSSVIYDKDNEQQLQKAHLTLVEEYLDLNEKIKLLETRKKEIAEEFNSNYKYVDFKDNNYKVKIAEQSRKGSFDLSLLLIDYPELDIDKYTKEPTVFPKIDIRRVKQK